MKTLWILGAGRGQVGLIQAAKACGYRAEVLTLNPEKMPGVPLADAVWEADIADPEQVLTLARRHRPDGIVSSCMDTGIRAVGKVCDVLGLPGLSERAALCCNDKYAMKQVFAKHGVSTARFFKVSTREELKAACETLRLPLIIKAVDLQGSRGIIIVRREEEVLPAFSSVMELSKQSYCIVEEFIEGREFGAQAFVYRGKVLFVLPHADKTYMAQTAVPIGHGVPFDGDELLTRQAEEEVLRAIRALGLDFCAVNVDLIERGGEVYVIELTGRVGANGLPEMTAAHFGIDYYAMIAAMAVGDDPEPWWRRRAEKCVPVLAEMLIEPERSGCLRALSFSELPAEHLVDLRFFVKPGEPVRAFRSSADCIGQLIVRGQSPGECEALIEEFKQSLRPEIE